MSKPLIGFLVAIIVIFFGAVFLTRQNQPKEAEIGVQHTKQESEHINRGESPKPYNSSPASSGQHYADAASPLDWGIYTEEVPDEVFIHNEEHGGVVVTYNPRLLPADDVKKLRELFIPPNPNEKFKPSRFILTPRSKNTKAIEMAVWQRTFSLDKYDKTMVAKFYTQYVNTGPEAGAKPTNLPINQAAS